MPNWLGGGVRIGSLIGACPSDRRGEAGPKNPRLLERERKDPRCLALSLLVRPALRLFGNIDQRKQTKAKLAHGQCLLRQDSLATGRVGEC